MTRLSHDTAGSGLRAVDVGVDPAPAMRARIGAALAAALGCVALIVGVPLVLYFFIGSRWPDRGPIADDFSAFNLHPTTDLLLGFLAAAGWILWAIFVLMVLHAVITTTIDAIRWGVRVETWKDATNPVRWIAGVLIGTVAALWPAAAHAAPAEAVDPANATRELTADELAAITTPDSADTTAASECATEESPPVVEVESAAEEAEDFHERDAEGNIVETVDSDPSDPSDDTLWGMAEEHYGDGTEYGKIFDHNEGITQSNGLKLTDPGHIVDDTEIVIPGTAPSADLAEPGNPESEAPPATEDPEPEPTDAEDTTSPLPPVHGSEEPSTETAEPDSDAGTELDGEGDITVPSPPVSPAPEETGASSTAVEDDATSPESSADDRPETAESISIPVGVWLSIGTFLAVGTVAALAARLRAKRRQPRRHKQVPERLSGRLTDLEAITQEDLRAPDHISKPVDEVEHAIPFGTDFSTTTDLTDLARPLLGLLGPGQGGAARGAIAAAIAEGQSVTVTSAAVDITYLDRVTEYLTGTSIALEADLEAVIRDTDSTAHLIICAASDIEVIPEELTEHAARAGLRLIVLSGRLQSSLTLAADGTVQSAEGHAAQVGLKQCYVADVPTLEALITGLAERSDTRSSEPPSTPESDKETEEFELDLDDLVNPAEYAAPVLGLTGPATAAATRAAIDSASTAGNGVVVTARAAITVDGGEPWPTAHAADIIAPDLPTALERAATTLSNGAVEALVVCTTADLPGGGPGEVVQQLEAAGVRALVLGEWNGAAIGLDSNGVITEATGVALPQWPSGSFLCDPPEMMDALARARDRGFGIADWETPVVDRPREQSAAPVQTEPAFPAPTAGLRLCVFGYPSVYLNEQPVALKQGRRALALLTALALNDSGQGCTRDDLLGAVLWDEPMGSAKKYLPVIVNDTRVDLCRVLGIEKTEDKIIVYDKRTRRYRLEADRFTIDRDEFDSLEQDAALAENDDERTELLTRAVSLYAGDLADQLEIDTLTDLRSQYRNAVRRACQALVGYFEQQGDTSRADTYRRAQPGVASPQEGTLDSSTAGNRDPIG
jgi:hypothetical protein